MADAAVSLCGTCWTSSAGAAEQSRQRVSLHVRFHQRGHVRLQRALTRGSWGQSSPRCLHRQVGSAVATQAGRLSICG